MLPAAVVKSSPHARPLSRTSCQAASTGKRYLSPRGTSPRTESRSAGQGEHRNSPGTCTGGKLRYPTRLSAPLAYGLSARRRFPRSVRPLVPAPSPQGANPRQGPCQGQPPTAGDNQGNPDPDPTHPNNGTAGTDLYEGLSSRTPDSRQSSRVTDGLDATLYPLTGLCLTCGQPARIQTYIVDWRHMDSDG